MDYPLPIGAGKGEGAKDSMSEANTLWQPMWVYREILQGAGGGGEALSTSPTCFPPFVKFVNLQNVEITTF